ncbi:PucR family transcriptional regulator [Microbispora cellulosiformans]|uniref:PucR family transcriptional regulator n=1 Tax=Microbispora cellulosiformans TaxID=2614688 RepID=A0A5J5JTN8_9ACTN|nr:PucR family transcriptional regulator [Microbispora cellulosiformans]
MVPLHLEVLAGRSELDRPVRWVAVSELEDPTPFLEGGELVLTTGMRLSGADAGPYVSRLVARGVAGLGFGVGLSHDVVPPEFADAAESAGLPLVEVPRDTPFIAIGKAVSDLLAGEQYEEISRAFAAQGRLTRAALRRRGPVAVVDRLAREIGGWALLLDPSGAVRHAADATGRQASGAYGPGARGAGEDEATARHAGEHGAAPRGPQAEPRGPQANTAAQDGPVEDWARETARSLEPEIARLRSAPSPASLALATPHEHVVVQPLGRRGFFAVGSPRPFSPIAHTVVNAAGSLLTLALEQGREQRAAAAQVRAAVLRLLLAGETGAAARTLAALGMRLPAEPVTVLVCQTSDPDALTEALGGAAPACLTAPWEGLLVVAAPDAYAEEVVALAVRYGRVGVGAPGVDLSSGHGSLGHGSLGHGAEPGPAGEGADAAGGVLAGGGPRLDLAVGLDQARRALASAAPVARFTELAGQGLLSLLDPDAAASFAAAILAPLREYGSRADLVESLRAYLASNGHWDAAAQRLGVHRHTLRYRMKRVSELLGRNLDDPAVRAELWIALCV